MLHLVKKEKPWRIPFILNSKGKLINVNSSYQHEAYVFVSLKGTWRLQNHPQASADPLNEYMREYLNSLDLQAYDLYVQLFLKVYRATKNTP